MSLTQTEYLEAVRENLLDGYESKKVDYDAMSNAEIKDILEAAANVSIANATQENGCIVFGIGKLRLHKKPARKARMGRNPATGEEIKCKAKPAQYVAKFRMSKGCKDGCLELVAEKNKKLQRKFRGK